MASKPRKPRPLRTIPRHGPEFVTDFKQHNAAGPMDTKRRRDRAVATGRSRKPKHPKGASALHGSEAEDNPWKESDIEKTAPCRKCGGEGVLPSFSHVHQGECFSCRGTGHKEKDWRCTPPEMFSILGSPVRVYTVKGQLKALVRQRDFAAPGMGTPMLYLGSPLVSTFFVRPNGHVQGAFQQEAGWTMSPILHAPTSAVMEAFPDYWETRFPEPPLNERTYRERTRIEERQALIRSAESRLARRIMDALKEHYRKM